MELSGRVIRQIVLLSLVALIVPMLIFPERFGFDLMKASFINAVYELVFYAVVIFLFHRKTTLIQLIQTAGICLIYRFALGMFFGVLIVVMYPMNFSIALSLGMSSYLPAIAIHILATPFILKPVIDKQLLLSVRRALPSQPQQTPEPSGVSISLTKEKPPMQPEKPVFTERKAPQFKSRKIEKSTVKKPDEPNGFENAVNYIGANELVKLSTVLDNEGLTLASHKRGDLDDEKIIPHSLNLLIENVRQLNGMGFENPYLIEYVFEHEKVVIATESVFSLLVVSERTADDILNIRINQGLEMIRKYIAERYSKELIGNAESINV